MTFHRKFGEERLQVGIFHLQILSNHRPLFKEEGWGEFWMVSARQRIWIKFDLGDVGYLD